MSDRSNALFRTLNPATGKLVQTFDLHTTSEVEATVATAATAFSAWASLSFDERKTYVAKVADLLEAKAEALARVITLEMGKPLAEAQGEVQKCAAVCRYFAHNASQFLAPISITEAPVNNQIYWKPLGVILGIFPWNYPLWQVFRFAAPTLMAGNVALMKHAPNVPQSAQAIEALFEEAGFPKGIFANLFLDNTATEALLADQRIAGVSLTGSERAGAAVAGAAGKRLKPSLLELGGSDPFIVLDDADVDQAVNLGFQSRFTNAGQACNAAKRFILQEKIAKVFLQKFQQKMQTLRAGDPVDSTTTLGPLARQDLLELVHRQVQETLGKGARLLMGGDRLPQEGFYYAPTILTDIPEDSPAAQQELFGPVVSVWVVASDEEALARANQTPYGLDATICSSQRKRAEALALKIRAGQVFINELSRSMVELPFGGVDRSGYGRELSKLGIKEFVYPQTIVG